MPSSIPSPLHTYAAPPAPAQGQLFKDDGGGLWKVTRLTVAQNPIGFYLVHLSYGPTLDELRDSLVLGPREFAALVRDRGLKPYTRSSV